jgi:serine/threonine-protein kinase RsbT
MQQEGRVVPIGTPGDILTARDEGQALAAQLGFSVWDQMMIAGTIAELARNILEFATGGRIVMIPQDVGGRLGLSIEARDEGPGIADPWSAVAGAYSSPRGPGFGLPGVKRLMDELDIASELGKGTTVTARKWRHPGHLAGAGMVPPGSRAGEESRCLTAP